MAVVTLRGKALQTVEKLPKIGTDIPYFSLINKKLAEISLGDCHGKKIAFGV